MRKHRVYGPFDPPPDEGIAGGGESPTDQSFKDDADINVIMARAERGQMPDPMVIGNRVGDYLDVYDAPRDYLEARLIVSDAEARFSELPAKVRSRFANDPFELLSFIADPANRKEAEDLGLVKARDEPVVSEPKAKAAPEGGVAQ